MPTLVAVRIQRRLWYNIYARTIYANIRENINTHYVLAFSLRHTFLRTYPYISYVHMTLLAAQHSVLEVRTPTFPKYI